MPALRVVALPERGTTAPWFVARCTSNDRYHLATVAGRYVVLCFFRSAADAYARAVLAGFHAERARFDDDFACFFGISVDPEDERQNRVQSVLPGYRYFWDFDGGVSKMYGALREGAAFQPYTLVLDERLRTLSAHPFDPSITPAQHVAAVMKVLEELPAFGASSPAMVQAPVLVLPRVFEPAFCKTLIEYYERGNSRESGVMKEQNGKTVLVLDDDFKRRRDCAIEDPDLRMACRDRVNRRLLPEVHKAFQFSATYAERYVVACYDASEGGWFRAHRDNTTKGTAHRRFAVTVNLNTGEYKGGCLQFPEYGRRTYEAPLGGAVVFSCSLLHAATPVTEGVRYAFLPFLYDETGARIREKNLPYVDLPE